MYVAFYRWRLKPGTEQEFKQYWEQGTLLFRSEHKALGSRLHKAEDGIYFAYAQWPSREMYYAKRELSLQHQAIHGRMADCVLESFPPMLGEATADLLVNPD